MATLELLAASQPRLVRTLTAALIPALLLVASAAAPAVGQEEPATQPSPASEAAPLPEGLTKKMVKKVEAVIKSVHPIRGLAPAEGVTYRVIDNEAAQAELEAQFLAENPAEYLDAEGALLKRLGLLEADQDLARLMLKVFDQQVLAYYDPESKEFTIIGPVKKIGPTESIVIALAQQALVEGDATAVMYDWAARELKLTDLLTVSAQALTQQQENRIGRLPDIVQRWIEFPYIDGYAFVNAIRGRGDWAAVDETWEHQPVSTEQILHPELYPGELPVEIELPDVAGALGPDWATSYEQTMGEMQTHVWLADGKKPRSLFPTLPAQLPKADAAAGWGGDRLISLDGPDGAWAVVWQTDWDSKDDQKEFRKAAKDSMKDLPGAHGVTNADVVGGLSSPVLVLVADSELTLDAIEVGLGL